jgi:hypothetical protein
MKYLKLFENFEDIDSICQKFGIENYTINSDRSIDVDGNVYLIGKGLTKLPLKFRNVTGDFYCDDNQLTTLEGSPRNVTGDFYCNHNQLTTLEGSPRNVTGGFYCNDNKLTSLEGGPQSVTGYFDCGYNQLTSLEGGPQSVGGNFYCGNNPVESIWNLFIDYSQVDMLNDYDPVRDGQIIILDRLNEFLEQIGKQPVTSVKGYKCI